MSRRVSRRRLMVGWDSSVGTSKCFTKTVPPGKVHSPVGANRMVESLGTVIHLDFDAPSDQKGTFKSYGRRLVFGISVRVSLKAPVWESNFGKDPLSVAGMERYALE